MAKKILVADDDINITNVLLKKLGDKGYEVAFANDGEQALKMIRKEKFDVIILDIMMRVFSGTPLGAVLKNLPQAKNIPLIFLTAFGDMQVAGGYVMAGNDAVFSKPFDFAKLDDKITAIFLELSGRRFKGFQYLIILVVVGAGLIVATWNFNKKNREMEQIYAAETASLTSVNGFVSFPLIHEFDPDTVFIIAKLSCLGALVQEIGSGRDGEDLADDLERQLKLQRIPYQRNTTAIIDLSLSQPPRDSSQRRLDLLVQDELPIVFIGNRAKSNPSAKEVIAEYSMRRK